MNKKLIASVAAACVLSAGSVFAASNPFADVPANHWSYGSVQDLAKAGIIDGYGDGTFKGDKTITRYEMAQLVGKAMYRSDKANAEQKAAIDKLAAEYKDELDNLGVRVGNVEKKTAGINDLKVTGWLDSENTVGNQQFTQLKGGTAKTNHEYALEARLGFEKQINSDLSATVQLRSKTFYDHGRSIATGGDTTVGTRLAYVTYKASPDTTFTFGKTAYWMAGGLLMDDFVTGVSMNTKLSDKTNLWLMTGRYGAGQTQDSTSAFDTTKNDSRISGASLTTTVGKVDLGAHYLIGNRTIDSRYIPGHKAPNDKGEMVDAPWQPIENYDHTKIIAGTAGYTFAGGVNLSLGYAKNNNEDKDNTTKKIQLYKKISGTDVIVQYWNQGRNMDWVAETGNHMAWWCDQYTGGIKGYRLILERDIMKNTHLVLAHGDYKNIETDVKARKDTVQVIVSF
jgi:hypothetical protein